VRREDRADFKHPTSLLLSFVTLYGIKDSEEPKKRPDKTVIALTLTASTANELKL
jgi:hypothetical protein